MEDDPGTAYRCLKRLSAQPGDHQDDGVFTLASHQEAQLTPEQSLECIAQHFASISQEFDPLDYNLLPPDVQTSVDQLSSDAQLPDLPDHVVYQLILRSKKPHSSVPGDLPRKLVKEFSPELAAPVDKIFRNIIRTGHWPKQWRLEYGTPIRHIPYMKVILRSIMVRCKKFLSNEVIRACFAKII